MLNNKTLFLSICIVLSLTMSTFLNGCSVKDNASEDDEYQINELHAGKFVLTDVFDGEGVLEEWFNGIDGYGVDERLDGLVNDRIDEFATFSYCLRDIINDEYSLMPKMLGTDVRYSIGWLLDPEPRHRESNNAGSFYQKDGSEYLDGFFSFLEKMDKKDPGDNGVEPDFTLHSITS